MNVYCHALAFSNTKLQLIVLQIYNNTGLHTNWKKLSFFEIDPEMRIPYRTVQLWRVYNDDVKTREVLFTLNGVDASILKKSYINHIIKSMLHHHEHATSLTLPQFDDLDDFISWNSRA